jgi:uncharacterized NAD(P)/FAD-binding protein YdhS
MWEILRHRMAPEVAARVHDWSEAGTVRVLAGRVEAVTAATGGALVAAVRTRGDDTLHPIEIGWVVNCPGPSPSNRPEANPAVASLLLHGWVCPDPLDLGLCTSADGRAISRAGEIVPDLHVIGTLRKPASWESTAVPELRVQSASVAATVVAAARRAAARHAA